ncbi:hypothetical protein [Nocardia brasiliensis]|uniref:hypothetical protein n=1 Tax=Nocardia brasiliensis TaxID=37326 RepID=UPI002457071B|nr:hypothetical protein [Nocardia brasiliensis]
MSTVRVAAPYRALLGDQIRSETVKIRSARALSLLPVAAMMLGPVSALLVGVTGSLSPGDTLIGGALTGASLSLAVVAAWGALVVTTEYSAGTIRPVLTATPQRTVVLAAKAIVVAVVAAVVGVLSPSVSVLVGLATIDAAKYPAGEAFPGLIGIWCCFPSVALLGVGAGVMLRGSVGAVAMVSAHIVLPQLTAAQAFGELHKWVTVAAPSAVVAKLSHNADAAPELMGSLGGWPRLAIVAATAGSALYLARRALERRDV